MSAHLILEAVWAAAQSAQDRLQSASRECRQMSILVTPTKFGIQELTSLLVKDELIYVVFLPIFQVSNKLLNGILSHIILVDGECAP